MVESRSARFILVGLLNTSIDFAILFLLTRLGVGIFVANMISTSVALVFSFFANRSITFRAGGDKRVQIMKFAAVTLAALWLVQPAIIGVVSMLLGGLMAEPLVLLVGKGCATIVSMIWNYFLYAWFVFPSAAEPRGVRE
ncbi:GtrA family protein [Microbacterium murale]|uniref:Flippase GtrA n=1 Tax=Microbacterium murale TaxID=1081040 RepID=A0ABU0PDH2_9MICO|nr:GtrA family protein [Microbacterium murale]MDQ0645057.1 putative flippase GtrA [Microbacterium murale]